ncbi:hypothetical protein BX600DRAFT_274630 [Xylariales sp. PMI_506]|nr:hypothetical protein BX600DRAFT_274630 [Xylariales sp. PMI_506]
MAQTRRDNKLRFSVVCRINLTLRILACSLVVGTSSYFCYMVYHELRPLLEDEADRARAAAAFAFLVMGGAAFFADLVYILLLTGTTKLHRQCWDKSSLTPIKAINVVVRSLQLLLIPMAVATTEFSWRWAHDFEGTGHDHVANSCRALAILILMCLCVLAGLLLGWLIEICIYGTDGVVVWAVDKVRTAKVVRADRRSGMTV